MATLTGQGLSGVWNNWIVPSPPIAKRMLPAVPDSLDSAQRVAPRCKAACLASRPIATLRVLRDIARFVWNIPAGTGAFRPLQRGLQQTIEQLGRTWRYPDRRAAGVGPKGPIC